MAEEGKSLVLVARRTELLQDLADSLPVECILHSVDVTDRTTLKKMFEELRSVDIDTVVNCAGAALGVDRLEGLTDEDEDGMINLNIRAFLDVAKLSIPHLKKTQGHIVNLGSIAGHEVYEGGATYCATKSFVHAISKGLRIDLQGTGIRVTTIAPGAVETDFSRVRFHGDVEKAKAVYKGYTPLTPEDIAESIAFVLRQPSHVNIEHLLIMPTAQASARRIVKE